MEDDPLIARLSNAILQFKSRLDSEDFNRQTRDEPAPRIYRPDMPESSPPQIRSLFTGEPMPELKMPAKEPKRFGAYFPAELPDPGLADLPPAPIPNCFLCTDWAGDGASSPFKNIKLVLKNAIVCATPPGQPDPWIDANGTYLLYGGGGCTWSNNTDYPNQELYVSFFNGWCLISMEDTTDAQNAYSFTYYSALIPPSGIFGAIVPVIGASIPNQNAFCGVGGSLLYPGSPVSMTAGTVTLFPG